MTSFRNDPEAVCRAVGSILDQSFADLELILVFEPDDPSTPVVRGRFDDPRLVLVENEKNLGRVESYNKGLDMVRGRYLARMDADDFSYPERLARQLAFLKAHSDIAVVGTNVRILDEEGKDVGRRDFPTDHAGILKAMMLINPMCHPTIMWDRDAVGHDARFDLRFSRFCDDLELWMRFIARGHRFANLPDILLDYQQANGHRRPRDNWRLSFQVRLLHWRLGLRYPRLFVGLAGYLVMSCMPIGVIDLLTGRNWFSDRLRRVKTDGGNLGP
jgi:glycosyltransferase involved in cell wall biosynthesis